MSAVSKRRAVWIILTATILGAELGFPRLLWADTRLSPEVDLYLTHNNLFRSRIVAGGNWSDTESQWSSGLFEYTVDFGLKSLFRRYVYKDPNVEKSKFFTVRCGYAYLPDFDKSATEEDENRGIVELTMRLPIGGQWLWSDRNRGDFRWIGDETSELYRNRLRVERGMSFQGFHATPYAAAEVYYDTAVKRWNRLDARAGIEIPWRYSTVFEMYYAHQAVWEDSPVEIIGFVIQKHMAMPIGGTQ